MWPAMLGRALPEDVEAVAKRHGGIPDASWSPGRAYAFSEDLKAVTTGRTASARLQVGVAVKAKGNALLSTLFYGRGPRILDALAGDHARGAAMAENEAAESCRAVSEFAAAVTGDLETAWRYPALVLGGVGEMGLLEERQETPLYPGFAAYAVEIGFLLGQTAWERLIPLVGGALFCIGLVVSGGALVAAAGLALDVAATAIAVARAREQELAAQAFDQLPREQRPIERPDWGPAALEAAAASFFHGVRAGARGGVARAASPPPTAVRQPLIEAAPSTFPAEPQRAAPSVTQPARVRPAAQPSPGSAGGPAAGLDTDARGLTDRGIGERGTGNRATPGESTPRPRDLEDEERIAAFRREQGDTPGQIRTFRERWRQERAAARSRALARGRDALDDELETAFREEPAAATGGQAPAGPRRTETQLGLTPAQTARIAELLGQRFDSARLARIGQAWDRIVSRLSQGRLAGRTGRKAYEVVRPDFWAEIRRDAEARKLFEEAGFILDDARPRTAPYLPLPDGGRVILRLLAELDPFQNPARRGWSPFREFGRAAPPAPEPP